MLFFLHLFVRWLVTYTPMCFYILLIEEGEGRKGGGGEVELSLEGRKEGEATTA